MAGKKFRVPIITGSSKEDKRTDKRKPNPTQESKWLEKNERQMECKLGKKKPDEKKEVEISSSDSGDEDLLNYWIHGDARSHTESKQVSTIQSKDHGDSTPLSIAQPEMSKQSSMQSQLEVTAPSVIHTHALLIPLYDNQTVKKRMEQFKQDVETEFPHLLDFASSTRLHLPILYLTLNGDQLDTLVQILQIPDMFKVEKKKPKLELQNIFFYCDDNSKNPKKANCLYTSVRKNEENNRMEETVHQLIAKMIEFGVSSEKDLANCRYDISAGKYKVEQWRINLLEGGTFDVSELMNKQKFRDYFFGTFEFNQIALCRLGPDLKEEGSIRV